MLNSKILLIAIVVLFSTLNAVAQLGLTRTEIKASINCDFKEGVAVNEDDYPFIYCIRERSDGNDETYLSGYSYFFDRETRGCVGWKILEPLAEINAWVKMCNKNYVSTGKMRWYDYARNIAILIEIDDNMVSVVFIADRKE